MAVAGEKGVRPVQPEAKLIHQIRPERSREVESSVLALLACCHAADARNYLIQRVPCCQPVVDISRENGIFIAEVMIHPECHTRIILRRPSGEKVSSSDAVHC